MNKLFSKIAALSVGLAMAIGVGVAIGSREAKVAKAAEGDRVTTLAGISSGTKYYIGATVSGVDYYWCATGGTDVGTGLSGTAVSSNASATPVKLSGSSSSWSLQFDNGNYLSLASAKANGKYNVVASEATFTISEVSNLLKISIDGTYCIQLNTSTKTQFGSYNGGQTNVWLEDATKEGPLHVTYDGNGATSGSMSDDTDYAYGDTVTIRACAFMRDNYEIVNWNTKSDGTGTSYGLSTTFTIEGDVTLYAQWSFNGDLSGDYVLTSTATAYIANPTNEDFHAKVANSENFTLSNNTNFRLYGSPNVTDIMLYGSSSFKLTAPVNYAIKEIVFNAYADNEGTTLTVGGFAHTVSNVAEYVDYSTIIYGNSVIVSGSARVWVKSMTITIVKVEVASALALDYAAKFIELTDAECAAKAVTLATWTEAELAFGHLEADFEDAAEVVKGSGEEIEAIARYKNIVEKYGYNDFLAKGYEKVEQNRGPVNSTRTTNNIIVTVAVSVSAIALFAFGMMILLKKRKHN